MIHILLDLLDRVRAHDHEQLEDVDLWSCCFQLITYCLLILLLLYWHWIDYTLLFDFNFFTLLTKIKLAWLISLILLEKRLDSFCAHGGSTNVGARRFKGSFPWKISSVYFFDKFSSLKPVDLRKRSVI
jgi:hypothetical protein